MENNENLILSQIKERELTQSNRLEIIYEIQKAQQKLLNYQMLITIKKNEPKFCTITFNHNDLSDFEVLKKYVGEYGFVVPVK